MSQQYSFENFGKCCPTHRYLQSSRDEGIFTRLWYPEKKLIYVARQRTTTADRVPDSQSYMNWSGWAGCIRRKAWTICSQRCVVEATNAGFPGDDHRKKSRSLEPVVRQMGLADNVTSADW